VLELSSNAFENNGEIPDMYTGKDKEISPPLFWKNAPKKTKSFALIMDDLDTPIGVLNHWVLYNIPAEKNKLSEDIPHQEKLEDNSIQGKNSMRKIGYMGPSPPWGTHRYVFRLYALDAVLEVNPKMNKRRLLKAIKDHIIEQSEILGVYSKK
jgi:Raf kinase inhibitor-like YbhB/YbcL family protein